MRDRVATVSVGLETLDRLGRVRRRQQDDDIVDVRRVLVVVCLVLVTMLMMVGLVMMMGDLGMVMVGLVVMMVGLVVMMVLLDLVVVVVAVLGNLVTMVVAVLVALAKREVRVRDAIVGMVVVPDRLVKREVDVGRELEPENPQQAGHGCAKAPPAAGSSIRVRKSHSEMRVVSRGHGNAHDANTSNCRRWIGGKCEVIAPAPTAVPPAMSVGTVVRLSTVAAGIALAALTPKTANAAPSSDPETTQEVGPEPAAESDLPSEAAPLEPSKPRRRGRSREEVRQIRVAPASRNADGLTASGRTIGRAAIRNTPKRSAEDLLRLVPGMLIVQHGNQGKGHQFYVRGFDAAHGADVELTVDDIPLNEPSNVHAHGYLDIAQVPADAVSRIDVAKGSYRLRQGNFATGASIDYRLGVPEYDRGTRVLYEVGTTNRHRAAVVHAPKGMSESTFLALEAMHDNGYGQNRRSQRLMGTGKVRLFERSGFHLDGLASAYAARFGLPGTVRIDDFNSERVGLYDAYQLDTQGESGRAIVGLTAGVETDKHEFSTSVYGKARRLSLDENFTGFLQFPDQGDRHHQVQEAGTLGVRSHWTWAVASRLKLLLHGNWQGNLIEQREDRLTLDGVPWEASRELSFRQNTWGIAPGLRAAPTKWFSVEGGVRLDLFHYDVTDHLANDARFSDTFFAASPRVTTQFRPGRRWTLFAAYGRGLRSPEARALTLPQGPQENVDLDTYAGGQAAMTTSDSAEVGARFTPGTLFDVGLSTFGTWIGRESLFDHVSGFNIELGPTQRLGVEADVQLHPTDWLDFGADVTAVYGRFRTTGAPIPGAPPLIVSTFGTLDHPSGWHTGWRWFLLGPRPLSYGATAGVSTVLDASVGYRHRKWFSVDLSIDNMLGLRWREGEYNFASHWDPDVQRSQLPTIHYIAGYPIGARLTLTGWF